MMNIYKDLKTDGVSRVVVAEKIENDCWINAVNPTEAEIQTLMGELNVDRDFLMAAMDSEERSRIDVDDETGHTLIVVDMPFLDVQKGGSQLYHTLPLGIVVTNNSIITICTQESRVINQFAKGLIKNIKVKKRSEFIWSILKRNAIQYLHDLKQIEKLSSVIEEELQKSMKNEELIQLLGLEKSLVYFSTSLKSNELVLEKLQRSNYIEKFEEDSDLLEEAIVENKQAIEMAKIYTDILSGTMDAFASIISNNLNIVMKFLALATIVMAIPTMISGFFGMNVQIPMQTFKHGFSVVALITFVACTVAVWVMYKKKMF